MSTPQDEKLGKRTEAFLTKATKQNPYLIVVVVVIALAGAGGYWLYNQTKKSATTNSTTNTPTAQEGRFSGRGRGGPGGQGANANFSRASGTLSAKTDSSLTITTSENQTVIVSITSSTRFNKSTDGTMSQITLDDLKVGDTINAMGEKNSSGQIEAQMVFDGDLPAKPQNQEGAPTFDQSFDPGSGT